MPDQEFKRHVAFKMRIGDLLAGKPLMDGERFRALDMGDKHVIRVNVIANIIDKYIQEGEKKYAVLTLDDASGQLKVKMFGDDTAKIEGFSQGDTVMIIGLMRAWNNEVYVTPEIIKKKDPAFLLIRKLEIDQSRPKTLERSELVQLRDSILNAVKENEANGGVDIEKMILDLKAAPDVINLEIKKLLEEGMVYEPRPGKLRYLG